MRFCKVLPFGLEFNHRSDDHNSQPLQFLGQICMLTDMFPAAKIVRADMLA